MKTITSKTVYLEIDELDENEEIAYETKFLLASDNNFYRVRFPTHSGYPEFLHFRSLEEMKQFIEIEYEIFEVQ